MPIPFLPVLFGGGLVTKVAMIALVAALAGSGVSCAQKNLELSSAKKEIVELREKNVVLQSDLNDAVNANRSTVEANKKLLDEREDAKRAIEELAKEKAKSQADLKAANSKIDRMIKDPKNDGLVSPVLRETLKDIQKRK